LDNSPPLSGDLEASLAFGMANVKASAAVPGSDPVKIEAALPIQLEKHDNEFALASNGPLSATVNFPAIFLENLPHFVSGGVFTHGILSGNLNFADSVQHPLIFGSVNLVDGKLLRGPAISAALSFKGHDLALDFLHLKGTPLVMSDPPNAFLDLSARGELDFADLNQIKARISPSAVSLEASPGFAAEDCVNSIEFYLAPNSPAFLPSRIQEIGLDGSLFNGPFTISFRPNESEVPEVFPFCRENTPRGKTLLLITLPFYR
ncbi:MAG: hypothetical protein QOJ05_48, partial [Verrucomicrobiota bacterium]